MLASGSGTGDTTAKIWNKDTGGLLRTIVGHSRVVRTVAFDTGNIVATGSYDNTVKLWNKNTGGLLRTLIHGAGILSVAFDATHLLVSCTGSSDTTVQLWNKNTGDLLRTLSGQGSYAR